MSRWELPDAWTWTTAGELASIVGGGTPPAGVDQNFDPSGIPWITPSDLTGYGKETIARGARSLSVAGYENSGAQLVPAGSVLFSSRAPIGYCVLAANQLATNQGFKTLVLRGETEPRFIRYYLLSSKEYAESLASGTTFLELSAARMRELEVPIAPVPEQRRIVAKLDTLRAHSRKAREALDEIPALLDQLKRSVLAAAFRGDLTADWRAAHPDVEPASALLERIRAERRRRWEEANPRKKYVEPEPVDTTDLPELPEGWCWTAVDNLSDADRGVTYGIVQTGTPDPQGVPTVRCGDVRGLYIESSNLKRVDPRIEEQYRRTRLRGGEVLVAIRGTVGAAAVADHGLASCNVSREVAVIPLLPGMTPEFVAWWIMSPEGSSMLGAYVKGVAQSGVNISDLKRLPIPVASKKEQDWVVNALSDRISSLASLGASLASCESDLGSLEGSTLACAFRGELVPQDPNDEPADALLARLRAAAPAEKPTRRGRTRE